MNENTLNNTLTAVEGIRVGHATNADAATGCTVILCPPQTIAAVDVRGGAPGTRETDLLQPQNSVEHVHAVLLAGGSAYGLAAADGVMRYLEEQGIGFPVGNVVVPIVPAAILFDLGLGSSQIRPDAEMGYAACQAATLEPVMQGSVGAGAGATVGKLRGMAFATMAGLGSVAVHLKTGLVVAAMMAVNAVGEILDEDGSILAGMRTEDGHGFQPVLPYLQMLAEHTDTQGPASNTLIGVVATNARLSKAQAQKVAQMAHDGIARSVRPAHTPMDGDTIFALATGAVPADPGLVGALAAELIAASVRQAVRLAETRAGLPSLRDI